MKRMKKTWKPGFILGVLLLFMLSVTALASGDNSLSALNVENGQVTPDFVYSTWEYEVKVAPGTSELILNPTTSDSTAEVTSITGTTLDNGTGTVLITVTAANGSPHTYTLHVSVDESLAPETESETEPVTEAPVTEPVTEAKIETPVTEITQNEAYIKLNNQVNSYKERLDLSMKIIYGLIGFSVLLLFIIINMILKNRDLKDDLRDVEEQAARQGNDFSRKEKLTGADSFYDMQEEPMSRKEKKAAKKEAKQEEKQRIKDEKRSKKQKGKKAEQQGEYESLDLSGMNYSPDQNFRDRRYQQNDSMNYQQNRQMAYQQQPVYQQQNVYQQQPVYQQQNVYQQQPDMTNRQEPFSPADPWKNTMSQENLDGEEKKDVDITMVEL